MSRTTRGRSQKDRRGAAAIELAMVAPFVFLLVFASFEFSRMMMVHQALTNAAREGSRNAALATTQNTANSKTLILDKLRGVIRQDGGTPIIDVAFSHDDVSSLAPGTLITTKVEVQCADVSWLPPLFFAGAKIGSNSTMTKE